VSIGSNDPDVVPVKGYDTNINTNPKSTGNNFRLYHTVDQTKQNKTKQIRDFDYAKHY
jgi:hypothetical protein